MNDPLRDNRIFPEEMHQLPKEIEKKSIDLTWLWTVLIILILSALVWFGYQYYQKNLRPESIQIQETTLPSRENQQKAFDSLNESIPNLPVEERQQKINTLFAN
jgi:predicted negative regulator of RcsB-dependent stress response